MSIVNLVSGGLDSTLIGVMAKEERIETYPLFVDYGQQAADKEWDACQRVHSLHGLPTPTRVNLSGYGAVIRSALTSGELVASLEEKRSWGMAVLPSRGRADVRSRALMAQSSLRAGGMRYGPGSSRERHDSRGGPSSDTAVKRA